MPKARKVVPGPVETRTRPKMDENMQVIRNKETGFPVMEEYEYARPTVVEYEYEIPKLEDVVKTEKTTTRKKAPATE